MGIFNKKEREIDDRAKEKASDLELSIEIELRSVNAGYSDDRKISTVAFKKVLSSNTDAKISDLLAELEGMVLAASQDFGDSVSKSRHLSDGYIAAQKEGEEE